MKKLSALFLLAGLLCIDCQKDSELGQADVSLDAAVLAVSVRLINASYDASEAESCGNSTHHGLQNMKVAVLRASSARGEEAATIVAQGKTSNRGSIAFKNMEIGTYDVQVVRGDEILEKEVKICEKKRVAVIIDF